jgi:hypothetical protein
MMNTYDQKLDWIAKHKKLGIGQRFRLDMAIHLKALQENMFIWDVADWIIGEIQKEDEQCKNTN